MGVANARFLSINGSQFGRSEFLARVASEKTSLEKLRYELFDTGCHPCCLKETRNRIIGPICPFLPRVARNGGF